MLNIPKTEKKRVVIVGCGFGGLTLAKKLKNKNFQVVILDKHNYHQFPPLFYSRRALSCFLCAKFFSIIRIFI
jgi:NADH dehydrogenase